MRKNIIILIGNIKHFLRSNSKDNIPAIAGQSAFFIILSAVPFLMFAFAILSFLGVPQNLFNTYIVNALPEGSSEVVQRIISEAYRSSVGIAFTTIILALWSAGKGIYTIAEGVRRIYKIPSKRVWLVRRLLAMGYTIVMFVVVAIAFALLLLSEVFDDMIRPYIKQLPYAVEVLYTLRYVVMFIIMVAIIAFSLMMFLRRRVRDKRYAKFRLQLPGAILSSLSWIIFSLGIRIYADYFDGFSLYGSVATIAVLMVWLYFSMIIFLCCVQINFIYRRKIYNFFYNIGIKRFFFKRKKK